ncbi:condensation domain-containing protein [Streptomyces sp. NPDC020898]|uniref:condensation domain-containing protein n=1 Tax=Streptomyces sp. NPDC020898 TaxID=3365101 RepID=UPI0037B675EF
MTKLSAIEIPYSGDRSGIYPLTWGQKWLWRAVSTQAPHYTHLGIPIRVEVPPGCNVDGVLAMLSKMIERHEVLRTRYFVDDQGVAKQVVSSSGKLHVRLCNVEGSSPSELAKQLELEMTSAPFTMPEISIRAAIVAEFDLPRFVILSIFHMAVDGWSIPVVTTEMKQLMEAAAIHAGQPDLGDIVQPIDRVQVEQGPEGVARSRLALEFWKRELERFPRWTGEVVPEVTIEARFEEHSMRSKRAALAVTLLSARFRSSPAAVLLTYVHKILKENYGKTRCGFMVFSHNRFGPTDLSYSGPLTQSVPVALEHTGADMNEQVRLTHQAMLETSLSCECDPEAALAVIDSLEEADGSAPDVSYAFNAHFSGFKYDTSSTGSDETSFFEVRSYVYDDMKFFIEVFDEMDGYYFLLRADTALFPSARIVEFLKGLEFSLAESAGILNSDITMPTGETVVSQGGG